MLKYAGLHPYFKSKLSSFYHHYLNCFLFFFLFILAAIECATNRDILQAIEAFSSVLFLIYTSCRYVINYSNKPLLGELLENQSKFWNLEDTQGHTRDECEHILKQTNDFIVFYKNYALILAATFYVQPFIFHELQMKIFVPDGWFYFLYIVYWYMTPPLFVSVYGVTSMFCAFAIPVVVQFKLLSNRFQTLKVEKNRMKLKQHLKELIDHHNFLFEYCKKLNEYSNGNLLLEYFITVSVCCILMFILSNDYPFVDKIKYAGFIVSQFLDTAVYCYSADLISEASQDVGSLVYDSENLTKEIIIVMARSQRQVVFSGYGIVWINMITFTKIFKATLSFVSYLNTVASME